MNSLYVLNDILIATDDSKGSELNIYIQKWVIQQVVGYGEFVGMNSNFNSFPFTVFASKSTERL